MALLRSVNNVPNIDYYEYRGNNFYNKYTYRAKLTIDGLRYANYVSTPEQLDKRLSLVNQDWVRANLSDLERFSVMVNRKRRSFAVRAIAKKALSAGAKGKAAPAKAAAAKAAPKKK